MSMAAVAAAQNAPPPPPPPEKMMFFAGGPPQEGMLFLEHMDMRAVKGAPYTATAVTESTQLLPDGNRIVHSQSGLVARDSEGRTRREETLEAMGPLAIKGGKTIFIHDPVAKSMIMLNPEQKTARVMKHDGPNTMKVMGMHNNGEANGDAHMMVERMAERGDVKQESLGTQTIEGLAAEGTRVTRTIAAGAIGNDKPIVVTIERWTSSDLHTLVLMKRSDPRFGETTFRLTNIKVGEPDSSLFQVPSGFTTEQSPMRMKLRTPPPGE
jgi:hypothetical protein